MTRTLKWCVSVNSISMLDSHKTAETVETAGTGLTHISPTKVPHSKLKAFKVAFIASLADNKPMIITVISRQSDEYRRHC
jgi:hypothetical protein